MESVVDTAAAATRPPRPRAPARLSPPKSPPAGAQPTQHLYMYSIYSGSVNQSLTADPPTYRNPVCLRLPRCTFCTEILHANFPLPFPISPF